MPSRPPTIQDCEPERNSLCVCGSGKKFKKCCHGKYSSKSLAQFRSAFNSGDYTAALEDARNHLTWYILAHKAHTAPLMRHNIIAAEAILKIDIEALADILDNLHACYFRLGIAESFIDVIEHTKNAIDDRRWEVKIIREKAFWYLEDKRDPTTALSVLSTIDLATCKDVDVLTIYLDAGGSTLSLMESFSIIDRILQLTSDEALRLQYRTLKAVKLLLICQREAAEVQFSNATKHFGALPEEQQTWYGKLKFAQSLEIFGKAYNHKEPLEQAKAVTLSLIADASAKSYSNSLLSDLYQMLGNIHQSLGTHSEAAAAYRHSLSHECNPLTKVFLSRTMCETGDPIGARSLLRESDVSELDEAGKYDAAISWSILAANSLTADDITEAKNRLRALTPHDPVFIQLHDRWMIELLETRPKPEQSSLRQLIRSLNTYVTLQPSIFGVGLNINKIIENIDNATETNTA